MERKCRWSCLIWKHVLRNSLNLRETKEELKISIELEELCVFNIDYGSEREFLGLFCGITYQTPQINESEVAQIKALVFEDLIQDFLRGDFDLSGGSRDTFQHLINSGKLAEYHRKSF